MIKPSTGHVRRSGSARAQAKKSITSDSGIGQNLNPLTELEPETALPKP